MIGSRAQTLGETAPLTTSPPQRLYVFNDQGSTEGLPTYAEYSLPNLKVIETSIYYSFSTAFVVFKGQTYFANFGAMYRLPHSSGKVAAVKLFGAANAGDVSVDGTGRLYAIDSFSNTVDEYSPGAVAEGGMKRPERVLSFVLPVSPVFSKPDTKNNVWVALNDGSVSVFGPTGTAPIAKFAYGVFVQDIAVDAHGTVWVLHEESRGQQFSGCTPDPKGPIGRYDVVEKYVGLAHEATLFSGPNDTNPPAHIVVAPDGRVYFSAQPEIVDYNPGAKCPDDALLVSNLTDFANSVLALDAGGNLYAGDTRGNNTITIYPPASKTPRRVLVQTVNGSPIEFVIQ